MTHVTKSFTTTAKENTPETGPCRELNGTSPDLAGSKRLPKLTSSPLLLFTGERQNEKSRPHPETKPSPKRLEIPHSPSMHHHHLISDRRRASIEQIESSSVTSST
ncbi:BnaA07g10660D [Brassica napus]|uniref:(rape) hypothetical protein n=1 Tax=Brassica napus TaxID=3708 RepID=A0A078I6W4_BRANA|nr:unnamed protein product [Brassica napus]CDY46630.1 BnaA07g10660D [Brassica napus]